MLRAEQTRPYYSEAIALLGAVARVGTYAVVFALGSGLLASPAKAQTPSPAPVSANQLPTGGQVNAGQASISQSGNTLNVNQTSQRAVVDWSTFNVGKDATVNFQQPNAQSATLNRVADTQPSQILGRITAPGQVVLVNPQGVYFGKSSSVDVGGLVATTHNAANQEFMDGQIKLSRNGATGKVENEGELRAALGGYIAMLAPEVRNSGVIVANLGTVALAAGESFELKFDGAGVLSTVRVTAATINTLVENKNAIKAPGGLIILSAQAASRLQSGVVNNSGTIEAAGLVRRAGRILLEASSSIFNSGSIKADAAAGPNGGPAGTVNLNAPDVQNSGTISATNLAASSFPDGGNQAAQVGRIGVQADTFTQTATGLLDVSAVALQAGTIDIAAAQAIAISGRVFANGVVTDPAQIVANALGGTIQLQATRRVDLTTAVLDASGEGGGGRIHIQGDGLPTPADNPAQTPVKGVVLLSTNTVLRVNSSRAQAGRVEIEGDDISLDTGTLIEAKGATKGGTVWVGGGWQGSGSMRQATTVFMSADSVIDASATDSGDGGEVVLWTDVGNANSVTTVHGSIYANTGVHGGDGGRIETSGHLLNVDGVRGSANGSTTGQAGSWLFDPYNVEITSYDATVSQSSGTYTPSGDSSKINVATINSLLSGTTNVTITTGNAGANQLGDIMVSSAITNSGTSTTKLRLQAANSIIVNSAISATGSAKLNVELDADNDNGTRNGGGIILLSSNITTNGGYLTVGGTVSSGSTGGDLYVDGGTNAITLSTSGGAVNIGGQLIVATSNTSGFSINSGGGNVSVGGSIDSGNSYSFVGITSGGSWLQAAQDAKNGTNGGSASGDSYLITITSKLENAIATYKAGYQGAWIGAYRDPNTSSWYWVGGPEAGGTYAVSGSSPLTAVSGASGTSFFTQGSGSAANTAGGNANGSLTGSGKFMNFGAGEPNGTGSGGENTGQFFGAVGLWNDLTKTTSYTSASTDPYGVHGYVRETNAVPSIVNINAGAGSVSIGGAVGGSKDIGQLNITSSTLTAGAIKTSSGFNLTNSGAVTLASAISGAGAFTKDGVGTLTLTGASSYTGTTTVNGGILKFGSTASIYASDITTNLYVNTGGVLDLYSWGWYGNLGGLRFDPPNLVINGGTVRYSGPTTTDWRSFTVGALGATFDTPTAGTTWTLSTSAQAPVISGNITFTGAGNTVMNHTLTGSGYNIIMNGTGNAALGGTNTYTGLTQVNTGILTVSNSAGLGSTTGTTTVASGASLEFTNNVSVPEAITVLGTGASASGAIRNLSGANALTGVVSLNGNTKIQSDAGSLTLMPASGNALTGSYNLTFDGAGTTMLGAVGTGTGSITKQGAGTLNMLAASTYSGGTTLSAGTLGVYDSSAIGSGPLTAAANTSVVFGRNVTSFANNITLNGSVTFDLDSTVDYLLVGGGGGGGGDGGAGGGGGGIRNITGADITSTTSFAVSVGAGGSYGLWGASNAGAGGSSSLTIDSTTYTVSGGSGGVTSPSATSAAGGAGANATATGGNGGTGSMNVSYAGTTGGVGGVGGNGPTSSITGSLTYYGGGGGGGIYTGSNGSATMLGPVAGGLGGGGAGGTGNNASSTAGTNGTNGLGGGGGGGVAVGFGGVYRAAGGVGGSGQVVVRYLGGSAGSGGTVTSGAGSATGYTLHSFTSTGAATLSLNPLNVALNGTISGSGSIVANAAEIGRASCRERVSSPV